MSTTFGYDMLAASLFGRTRRAVLGLLFGHADETFYLREIARITGCGLGGVQRELGRLTEAGILRRTVRGSLVFFEANRDCPVFEELKGLVVKTAGVVDVLRGALATLAARIRIALVYGSVARGDENRASDVDLLVVGDVSFAEIVTALGPAQETLRREVNPTVYPPEEFTSKLVAGEHFLGRVVEGEKLFVLGSERELEGLAPQRPRG